MTILPTKRIQMLTSFLQRILALIHKPVPVAPSAESLRVCRYSPGGARKNISFPPKGFKRPLAVTLVRIKCILVRVPTRLDYPRPGCTPSASSSSPSCLLRPCTSRRSKRTFSRPRCASACAPNRQHAGCLQLTARAREQARLVFNPLTNHSAVDLGNPTEMHYFHSIGLSVGFLACAALVAFFVVISLSILEKGVTDPSNPRDAADVKLDEYVSTNAELSTNPGITMWNNVFVAFVVLYHGLLVTVVNSPTSIHFLALVTLLAYFSISTIIQPRLQAPEGLAMAAASNISSHYLLAVCSYCVAMAYTATNVPYDPHSYRAQLIGAVAFLDLFLLILGHVWDQTPIFATVANCRIMYALSVACINLATYAAWDWAFRVEYIKVDH